MKYKYNDTMHKGYVGIVQWLVVALQKKKKIWVIQWNTFHDLQVAYTKYDKNSQI